MKKKFDNHFFRNVFIPFIRNEFTIRKTSLTALLFLFSYLLGCGGAYLVSESSSSHSPGSNPGSLSDFQTSSSPDSHLDSLPDSNISSLPDSHLDSHPDSLAVSAEGNWGLSFQEEGKTPVGNASIEELASYDAYYAQDTKEKVIYLTFDAGYESGDTAPILDALKKHNAPATFFVVGTYIESEPELVKRMVSEGHTVGNHTWHHPDMSKISSLDAFQKELSDVEAIYREVTGEEMTKFYRPPQGKYSEHNLKMAQQLGYSTFFWSLAYVDWNRDDQPSKEEAFEKLVGRIHPGAIVLLHSTSSTNAQILDELLNKWEEMGYKIRPLTELSGQ